MKSLRLLLAILLLVGTFAISDTYARAAGGGGGGGAGAGSAGAAGGSGTGMGGVGTSGSFGRGSSGSSGLSSSGSDMDSGSSDVQPFYTPGTNTPDNRLSDMDSGVGSSASGPSGPGPRY